ncbi:MAG: plasmid partitioning protein RepB [Aestuariivita sp.]|nr:plasmid partitioning protein RepB [Aestuariivita sp.]MCY4345367.1 plasmid partitioning protein RepB [Aestuariivita sp.]
MAMSKNKQGILAAISAAAVVEREQGEKRAIRATPTLPKGTIGSVRAGLGGIQEISTNAILPWGPRDRLDIELTAVNWSQKPLGEPPTELHELIDSIGSVGQQVPVLLRPAADHDGCFEVIYGQRRVLACRHLGIAVRALVRTLDDSSALMAKGLENSRRDDLSYYEKVRFAAAILEQGYSRADVCQALSVSKQTLSQMEKVNRMIPQTVGDAIGPAKSAGRPKWMTLGAEFEKGPFTEQQALQLLANFGNLTSDELFEVLLIQMRQGTRRTKPPTQVATRQPLPGVTIKSGATGLTLTVQKSGKHAAFARWLDHNLEQILKETFERFESEPVS